MKDLRTRTVKATAWIAGAQIASQIISFGFGIALARLLVPQDFGLIAMVVVFTGLAGLLSDVGLGSALIQKKDTRDEHFSSVFWLNLLLGCGLMCAIFLAAPSLSAFYERPEVEGVTKVLSLGYVIGALALVPRTRLVKELSFKYIAVSDVAAMAVSGLIAVTLAFMGLGYWSLVIHSLLRGLISTALIWVLSGWRPTTKMDRNAIGELLGFSTSVFATRMLQYSVNNLDKLLLGKALGAQTLGLYDKAQSMMLFPLQNVSRVIGKVMFPSLSLIQTDITRVRDIYLRSTRAIALLTFPMMTGMFVVAESFVFGVLGPHWADLIPVLRIFCVAGVVSSIVTVTGSIYLSQGKAALQLRVNLVTKPITILGLVAGLHWGVLGVATGYTLALFINSVITLTVAGRLIDLKLLTVVRSLAPTLLPASVMAILVWMLRPVSGLENELLLFLVQAVAGVIIYGGWVALLKLSAYKDVTAVLGKEFAAWRSDTAQKKPTA